MPAARRSPQMHLKLSSVPLAVAGRWLLAIAAAVSAVMALAGSAAAQEPETGTIQVLSTSAVSEFPTGIRFRATVSSEAEITSMAVRFRVGLQERGVYEYLDYRQGDVASGELFWRTARAGGYIPPETIITYLFEVEDADGNVFATEPAELILEDVRFTWERVSEGPVSVAYHGPVITRAEAVLEAIVDTLEKMGPVLGAGIDDPIRVIIYNNQKEMLEALPPRSATVGRELITEGQAFNEIGTLLVLAGGRLALGTASHEVTHILNYRAGHSVFRRLPSWLHEGLAEYGNVDPGFSYDVALEFAVATDRLLPHLFMQSMPGHPEDVIIFYGQSKSTVRFMIDLRGEEGMRRLLSMLKQGVDMDTALTEVYGLDRLELTNAWRASIEAEPYMPPEIAEARPTPVAYATVQAFTLTPQAGGRTVGDTAAQDPTPAGGGEPTAAPETPEPSPNAAPSPTPDPVDGPGGGGCGAGPGGADAGMVAMAVLVAGLGAGAASRRRR